MRKLVAGLAITLDGVTEAPGGNWVRFDQEMSAYIETASANVDALLLGRRSYLRFAEMWSGRHDAPGAKFWNETKKYVVSSTLTTTTWNNSVLLSGDTFEEVSTLKEADGGDIQIPGSPSLVRSLMIAGLVDELGLMIHPVALGAGQRLFDDVPDLAFELNSSRALQSGVLVTSYRPVTCS